MCDGTAYLESLAPKDHRGEGEKAIMGSVKGLFRLGFSPEDASCLPSYFGYTLTAKNKLEKARPV